MTDKSGGHVSSVSIDMYKYLISEVKSKRIEYVENIVKECSVDYYINVDTITTKQGFGEDISTYMLWYHSSVGASIQDIVSKSEKRLSTGTIGKLLNTKTSIVEALVGKSMAMNGQITVREMNIIAIGS